MIGGIEGLGESAEWNMRHGATSGGHGGRSRAMFSTGRWTERRTHERQHKHAEQWSGRAQRTSEESTTKLYVTVPAFSTDPVFSILPVRPGRERASETYVWGKLAVLQFVRNAVLVAILFTLCDAFCAVYLIPGPRGIRKRQNESEENEK